MEGARRRYGCRPWIQAFRALGQPRAATPRKALEPKQGQSLVELALVVPVLLILVFAIVAFGTLYEDKITMDTAARDGARWATQNPAAWDDDHPADPGSIQYQIQNESGTSIISNDNAHINISYYRVSSLTDPDVTYCGQYDQPTDSLVNPDGTPESISSGCLTAGSLIKVTVTHTFPLPVPILSAIFAGGVRLQASATMMEEVSPS